MTNWQEQMEHQPTREYYEFFKGFFDSLEGKKVLEIGYQYGISARAFLEMGAELVSVDINDPIMELPEDLKRNFTFLKMSSDHYFLESDSKYDIVYVDGDHHYGQTLRDLNNAWSRIGKGGSILLHDVFHNNNFKYDEKKCSQEKGYGITEALAQFVKEKKVSVIIQPPYPFFATIIKLEDDE